ncbi:hypothetical protein IFHNHDMJ_00904 [Synechococcus sp. CBW1107]|nr:hypothetical protein IFHNHDMJ_00904 [Synechococcus sp. CBW1107]
MSLVLLLFLGLAAVLLGLILSYGAWIMTWWILDHWTEAARVKIRAERLRRDAEAYARAAATAQQANRARARRASIRVGEVFDLDGKRIALTLDQLSTFRTRCCLELDLNPSTSWSEIRQQWRRRSMAWHPDHGGSLDVWLRKQRAYEALAQLNRWQSKQPH